MDAHNRIRREFLVELKRWQVVAGGLFAIAVPTATAYTSYIQAFSQIEQKFAAVRLESEQAFVKKSEMDKVTDKLDQISAQISEVKGYIRARDRR